MPSTTLGTTSMQTEMNSVQVNPLNGTTCHDGLAVFGEPKVIVGKKPTGQAVKAPRNKTPMVASDPTGTHSVAETNEADAAHLETDNSEFARRQLNEVLCDGSLEVGGS